MREYGLFFTNLSQFFLQEGQDPIHGRYVNRQKKPHFSCRGEMGQHCPAVLPKKMPHLPAFRLCCDMRQRAQINSEGIPFLKRGMLGTTQCLLLLPDKNPAMEAGVKTGIAAIPGAVGTVQAAVIAVLLQKNSICPFQKILIDEVKILSDVQILPESGIPHQIPPQHNTADEIQGRGGGEEAVQSLCIAVAGICAGCPVSQMPWDGMAPVAVSDKHQTGARNSRAGGFQSTDQLFQQQRVDTVIAVQKKQIFSGSGLQTLVPGGGYTCVVPGDQSDPGIFSSQTAAYFRGLIRGAVVNDENFKIRIALGQDRAKAFFDDIPAIVYGEDDADRSGHGDHSNQKIPKEAKKNDVNRSK